MNETISLHKRKLLRAKAQPMSAHVRIGKAQITKTQIAEINKVLKTKELIKIKVLQSIADQTKSIKEEIIQQTGAELIHSVGHTFVIYKKRA